MLTLLLAFGSGIFVAASALIAVAVDLFRSRRAAGPRFARTGILSGLSGSLQKWVTRAEKEMRLGFLRRRGPLFFLTAAPLAAAAFWFGLACLGNPAAAFVLAAIGVVFPEQVLHYREQARREKILEQLGAAVRVFAAEYADTPHAIQALGAAARKLPDPIGGILRQVERDLINKERDEALLELGRKLDSEYGRMFVQLLRLSFEDEAVKPLFTRLALRLTEQQSLIRKNRVEVAADRAGSLGLSAAAVPVYFMMQRVVPESAEFFTMTLAGKFLVCLCMLSLLGAMLMDRLMGGADVD
ncbi:MAG: type II secretion system F family protein [Moorellales bacterium]